VSLAAAAIGVIVPVAAYYLWARHLALTSPPYAFAGDDKFLWHASLQEWLANDYFLPALWRNLVADHALWGWGFFALALIGALLKPPSHGYRNVRWLFHVLLLALAVRYLVEARHLVAIPTISIFSISRRRCLAHMRSRRSRRARTLAESKRLAVALVALILAGSAIHAHTNVASALRRIVRVPPCVGSKTRPARGFR
jgi:hypothetical protein